MALTYRWAGAHRDRRQAGLLLAADALTGLLFTVVVVAAFPRSARARVERGGRILKERRSQGCRTSSKS